MLATNRHVAEVFARKGPGGYPFLVNPSGVQMSAKIDFAEEVGGTAPREVEIEKVLNVAEPGQADVALLQVKSSSILPGVIPLAARDAVAGTLVGVVGYPAYDSRNDARAMRSIFGETFDIKRFAPGYATGTDAMTIQHDCSTLGGNSGSPEFSLEKREILGLHFSGRIGVSNYAVKASVLRSVLSRVRPISVPTSGGLPLAPSDEGRTRSELESRRGYDEAFLGTTARLRVPLPNLSAEQMEDAVVAHPGHWGQSAYILDYMHFSLAMCKSRRTAYFTAVNIDGSRTVAVRSRRPAWIRDPRIPADDQIGDEVYGGRNNVDRGHLVRRLDPVWGDPADARQANDDMHIFTNAAPQQHTYNDAVWGDLEDYLLNNTRQDRQLLTIFTGPVFREGDMDYKGAQIPEEFWKVAVAVGDDDELRAAGYVVIQRPYLDDLEFIPGRFRTFQRSIRDVEELTGHDFGVLRAKDVMGGTESVAVEPRVIRGPADVSL